MSCHTTITTYGGVDETSHVSLQQLFETMDILIGGLNVINDDTQRLTSESFQYQHSLQSVSEDASKLKIAIEATHSSINAHRTNQQILEESLNSCKQQLDDQKNISIDGTLLWKITNLQQKIDSGVVLELIDSKVVTIKLALFLILIYRLPMIRSQAF
ncbi:unnamed protein product [Rotaria sordida]|nr:unnamed protein product [Rotaria sordida]